MCLGTLVPDAAHLHPRDETAEIAIALLGFDEHRELPRRTEDSGLGARGSGFESTRGSGSVTSGGERWALKRRDRQFSADDGSQAGFAGCLMKSRSPVHTVG